MRCNQENFWSNVLWQREPPPTGAQWKALASPETPSTRQHGAVQGAHDVISQRSGHGVWITF